MMRIYLKVINELLSWHTSTRPAKRNAFAVVVYILLPNSGWGLEQLEPVPKLPLALVLFWPPLNEHVDIRLEKSSRDPEAESEETNDTLIFTMPPPKRQSSKAFANRYQNTATNLNWDFHSYALYILLHYNLIIGGNTRSFYKMSQLPAPTVNSLLRLGTAASAKTSPRLTISLSKLWRRKVFLSHKSVSYPRNIQTTIPVYNIVSNRCLQCLFEEVRR